jgi:hypothetical protein
VYDDTAYAMQQANLPRYLFYKSLLRREVKWIDLPPPTRSDFLVDLNLPDNFANMVPAQKS